MLDQVPGLVEDMARVGLVTPIFQFWDRPSNTKIAEFDHKVLAGDTRHPYVIQCEQFKTAGLLLERIGALPNVEVLFRTYGDRGGAGRCQGQREGHDAPGRGDRTTAPI